MSRRAAIAKHTKREKETSDEERRASLSEEREREKSGDQRGRDGVYQSSKQTHSKRKSGSRFGSHLQHFSSKKSTMF